MKIIQGNMKTNIYKLLLAVGFALCAAGAGAQMKTAYFMEGAIPRYDMNAALTPMHGYANMPGIGFVGANLNNNFLSVHNFIYPRNGGHVTFLHESVDARDFLKRIPNRASLNVDATVNLIGFGFYSKRNNDRFWSFGLNLRAVADAGIPKEVFTILKDLRNGDYDIPDVTASGIAYAEFAVGFTTPVGWKNLVVGGRLKFLMGGVHAEASFNNMNLSVTTEQVTATFGGTMRGSIFGMDYRNLESREDGTIDFDDLGDSDNRFNIGNGFRSYGAAIDIGAEMKFLDDRLKVSLALNDLGFIYWDARNSFQGTMDDVAYAYHGYNWDEKEWKVTEPDGDPEFRGMGNEGYSKRLSTTMNAGVEYTFLDNLLGAGLLSHTRFSNRVTYSELTLAGTVRPADWFTTSISHTLIHNRIGIFGFAFNFHPRAINFFFGVDYITAQFAHIRTDGTNIKYPLRAKSANMYIGLAFTPGKRFPSRPW